MLPNIGKIWMWSWEKYSRNPAAKETLGENLSVYFDVSRLIVFIAFENMSDKTNGTTTTRRDWLK